MKERHADRIAASLEEMIFNGVFANGERLDEIRLAEHFGVSRTPLREALQRLTLSGMVELIPRRGAFVREPGTVELMEMYEVMGELEAACGRLAARRISDAALQELQQVNERCAEAMRRNDAEAYHRENGAFHALIYQQSGNAFLAAESTRLHRRLRPYRRVQLHFRGRLEKSLAEHEEIVDALCCGDSERAANALRLHVALQGERFHQLLAGLREQRTVDLDPLSRQASQRDRHDRPAL